MATTVYTGGFIVPTSHPHLRVPSLLDWNRRNGAGGNSMSYRSKLVPQGQTHDCVISKETFKMNGRNNGGTRLRFSLRNRSIVMSPTSPLVEDAVANTPAHISLTITVANNSVVTEADIRELINQLVGFTYARLDTAAQTPQSVLGNVLAGWFE